MKNIVPRTRKVKLKRGYSAEILIFSWVYRALSTIAWHQKLRFAGNRTFSSLPAKLPSNLHRETCMLTGRWRIPFLLWHQHFIAYEDKPMYAVHSTAGNCSLAARLTTVHVSGLWIILRTAGCPRQRAGVSAKRSIHSIWWCFSDARFQKRSSLHIDYGVLQRPKFA